MNFNKHHQSLQHGESVKQQRTKTRLGKPNKATGDYNVSQPYPKALKGAAAVLTSQMRLPTFPNTKTTTVLQLVQPLDGVSLTLAMRHAAIQLGMACSCSQMEFLGCAASGQQQQQQQAGHLSAEVYRGVAPPSQTPAAEGRCAAARPSFRTKILHGRLATAHVPL